MSDATWARQMTLAAQRAAEDERLIQRYAQGEGRGRDMSGVRRFVRHVRGDLGPRAIICDVKIERDGTIVVWYYFPTDNAASGADQSQKAPAVSDIPTLPSVSVPKLSGSDREGASLTRSSADVAESPGLFRMQELHAD